MKTLLFCVLLPNCQIVNFILFTAVKKTILKTFSINFLSCYTVIPLNTGKYVLPHYFLFCLYYVWTTLYGKKTADNFDFRCLVEYLDKYFFLKLQKYKDATFLSESLFRLVVKKKNNESVELCLQRKRHIMYCPAAASEVTE